MSATCSTKHKCSSVPVGSNFHTIFCYIYLSDRATQSIESMFPVEYQVKFFEHSVFETIFLSLERSDEVTRTEESFDTFGNISNSLTAEFFFTSFGFLKLFTYSFCGAVSVLQCAGRLSAHFQIFFLVSVVGTMFNARQFMPLTIKEV